MDAALAPEAVSAEADSLLAAGSRGMGQEGCRRVQARIRAAFTNAGLTVYELPERVLVPRTLRREILDAGGQPLAGTEIYPFQPNQLQPISTPEGGITGTLVRVTDDLLRTRLRFDDAIALIDVADAPATYGRNWSSYAQLGFRAVILAHHQGLAQMRWPDIGGVRTSVPVNYPRLAASAGIFGHVGETVTLHVRCVWDEIDDTTLVGILPGRAHADQALVIEACADAPSILPDAAPGTLCAINLAAQQALLRGIAAYRDDPGRKRDVIFVSCGSRAMAQSSVDSLLSIIGAAWDRPAARQLLVEAQTENRARQHRIAACRACLDELAFLDDLAVTASRFRTLDAATQKTFSEELRYTLNSLLLERSEVQLQARLAFLREGGTNTASAAFASYRAAKERYDEALSNAGLPLRKLLGEERPRAFAAAAGLRERLVTRLDALLAFHAREERRTAAGLVIHDRLAGYRTLIMMGAFLAPAEQADGAGETLTFAMGNAIEALSPRQGPIIGSVLQDVLQQVPFPGLRFEPWRGREHNTWAQSVVGGVPPDAWFWNTHGHPAFVLENSDRAQSYALFGSPVDEPVLHHVETLRQSLRVLGRTALALAFGNGAFDAPLRGYLTSYSGRVYVANVGQSIVPNYPLQGALIGHKGRLGYEQPGYNVNGFLRTDPYGRYQRFNTCLPILPSGVNAYSPEATACGADGVIAFMKDEGAQGQRVYKSINVGRFAARKNINIVVFRATPVTLFDLVNPQSLKAYSGVSFLRREGLADAPKRNVFTSVSGLTTAFLEPDIRFFVALKAGAVDTPQVQTIRSFLLGAQGAQPASDAEIEGRGYLAADTPFLLDVPREAAHSMQAVNGRRLDLQDCYHMVDARVRAFHERAAALLAQADTPGRSQFDRVRDARGAVTYDALNHPVLRRTITEAVIGILWYLGLLVPFVFFFEKLAFGFADIRRQLAAQATIFLAVFLLLRLLHPAFAMIRSSLMILLGFVILLISGGITVLFAGKFHENLEALRKQRGQATAADVSTLGVLGTAFALGLNNMHRRIVRTGLTCATLVLLTFAMICFTSIRSDLVDTTVAVGKAPYQGLLVRGERCAPMSDAELFALRDRYGDRCALAPRRMTVGHLTTDQVPYNPDLEAVYAPASGPALRAAASSVLEFAPDEPLRGRIRLLTRGGWFTAEQVRRDVDVPPVLIADGLAAALGIRPADVDAGPVRIKLNGKLLRVQGIFDGAALAALRDLDGRDLLPFNLEAMRTVQVLASNALAEDTDPRLDAASMVITPPDLVISSTHGRPRLVSVAVCMDSLPYKTARNEVMQYLEQSGQTTSYGLNGVAYRGRRARDTSLGGLMELLVPLLIAAMTVLNTMKGSVYERRDEIFVYNAVGIAPRYVFAMFFSEAFVYAVVGSMLGFLLSQGVGRVLTALNWTGGLPMTFTSIHTIYASLAIMAAVFLSTLFPARSAMRIAAPAEESGWRLPEPVGDDLRFVLPFTFSPRDRLAVLAFSRRHLLDHGEGGAGRFFASPPELDIAAGAAPTTEAPVPVCAATIWLKPFDLGVSQRLTIAMPHDPETGEFAAEITLTRLSGSCEAWLRLNGSFVAALRRHFLYWRAVGPAERRTLFDEARRLLESQASPALISLKPET